MTEPPETDTQLTAPERELAEALAADRPIPSPGFRGALGRHLHVRDPGYGTRPERLRLTVSGLLAGGAVLIALGLLQATGAL
jgi:hypothetical protein